MTTSIVKCQGCGAEKDLNSREVYPYEEDRIVTDRAIVPVFYLDCEGEDGYDRKATVCFECFHKIDPDLWISQRCWESINPVVPFDQLEMKK